MEYAPFSLSMELIDESGYKKIQEKSLLTKKAVEEGRWVDASKLLSEVENIISKESNNVNLFNVMSQPNSNLIYGDYTDSLNQLTFFMNTVVKQKLNLDIYWGHTAFVAQHALDEDFMKPVIEQVEMLLNETDIRVYVFNGVYDVVVSSAGTLKWMKELRWKNAEHWKHAMRKEMKIDGVIEGYVKLYDKLKMFWINQAGHMVAADNLAAVNEVLADMTIDL